MEYQQQRLSQQKKRRQRRRRQRRLRFAVAIVSLLILAGVITLLIRLIFGPEKEEEPQTAPPPSTNLLAPLPITESAGTGGQAGVLGPVFQSGEYRLTEHDFSDTALPECGVVTKEYFSDAAFLGDSITAGLTDYDFGLDGTLVCGYVGASPIYIVNGTSMEHAERGKEVPLEVLQAAQPAKLYLLMGTNLLVTEGIDESFLNYFGKMLDLLQQALPQTIIYVQDLLPVRPEVTEEKPGLDNDRLRNINEELHKLADERGMYYLNLQELFADEEGNLKEEYAAGDGIHLNIEGYQAWLDYLCRHTVYDPENPWLPGSTYAAE